VKINGSLVGYATGMSFSRTTNTKVIYEIDSPYAAEIMPTTYLVQGNLTGLRIRGSGGLDGPGIKNISTPVAIFSQKYCTIEVQDLVSKKTIYTFNRVMFDQDSWTIQSRALITFSASFKAVFLQNEMSASTQSKL
jgi:hypothetical protein